MKESGNQNKTPQEIRELLGNQDTRGIRKAKYELGNQGTTRKPRNQKPRLKNQKTKTPGIIRELKKSKNLGNQGI